MAVTFQHKIILRPGSIFCFGTISSVVDEEGTLHRLEDPSERKPSSKIFEKIGARQEKAQPPALLKRSPLAIQGLRVLQLGELRCPPLRRENGHGSQGKKKQRIIKLIFLCLLSQRRTERRSSWQLLHSTPTSSSSGEWSRPPSPTTSRLHPERNLLSGNPADEGTDAEISGDITRPESGTRCSLYRETRSQR
jgi:hypothetical protein